jgi:hypothetical protein
MRFYPHTIGVHALDSIPYVTALRSKELLRYPVIFRINHHTSVSNRLCTVQQSPS